MKIGRLKFKITRSSRKNKKFRAEQLNGAKKGRTIHFGARGFRIGKAGSKKQKSYCARSAGIKSKRVSANRLSRKRWGCRSSR